MVSASAKVIRCFSKLRFALLSSQSKVIVAEASTPRLHDRQFLPAVEVGIINIPPPCASRRPARALHTGNTFEIGGSDTAAMIALLLRRRRQGAGASLSEIASRLGVASRNAYARYERGDAVPTVEKLDELLRATAPGGELVLRASEERR